MRCAWPTKPCSREPDITVEQEGKELPLCAKHFEEGTRGSIAVMRVGDKVVNVAVVPEGGDIATALARAHAQIARRKG